MTRDEIFALFNRREAAWQARDAASLTADHAADGVVVSPTGGVLEGRVEIERIYRVWFTAFPDSCSGPRICSSTITGCACCAASPAATPESFWHAADRPAHRGRGRLHLSPAERPHRHERRILDFTGLLVQVGVLRAKPAG